MKKNPEHLEQVANLFKTYIPYTDGKITRFFAPYDGRVNIHVNESNIVYSGVPIYTMFPCDKYYTTEKYTTDTNGFMLKSNVENSEDVKKGDLICIVVEPYSKNIQKSIKDYFMMEPKIADIRREIDEVKHGNYGLPRMNTSFLNYIHSIAPDFLKPNVDEINKSVARLTNDIEKCKSEKIKLCNKLKQYYSTEILKLRQYL